MWRKYTIKKIVLFSIIASITFGLISPLFTAVAKPGGGRPAQLYSVADKYSPSDGARSWLYYNLLLTCVQNHSLHDDANGWLIENNNRVTIDNAKSGKWFTKAGYYYSMAGGYYLDGSGLSLGTDNGKVACDDEGSDWILDAVNLWGYKDGLDALCAFGLVRESPSPSCYMGDDSNRLKGNASGDHKIDVNTFNKAVLNRIYSIYGAGNAGAVPSSPTLSTPQEYIFYRNSFFASCLGDANKQPASPNDIGNVTDTSYIYSIKYVSSDGSSSVTNKYIGTMRRGDTVGLYPNSTHDNDVSKRCDEMEAVINKDANDYRTAVKIEADVVTPPPNTNSGPGGANSNTCGSSVKLLGWIVCPIINAIASLNDIMWKIIKTMLTVDPLKQNDAIYTAWGAIRSIANAIFVIFFMVIIFSQLTGAGITNYGIKKMLPKIIIAAILVNVSFVIVQGAVDLSNIIGSSLYSLINGLIPDTGQGTWQMLLNGILSANIFGTLGVGAIILVAGSETGFWMLLPFILMALLGLVAAFLTLAFRQAAIPILAILAPLAFVAYLLPNTESWFKKWRGLLMSMLILYPLAAVIFAGAQFASVMIIGNGHNFLNYLIGMTILALPLFSLPFLARQGGAIQGRVAGALNGLAQRARPGITNFSRDRAEAARAMYIANDPEHRSLLQRGLKRGYQRAFGRERGGEMYERSNRDNPFRRGAQMIDSSNKKREIQKESDINKAKTNWNNEATPGSRGSRAVQDRAERLSQHVATDAQETKNRVKNDNRPTEGMYGGQSVNDRKESADLETKRVEGLNRERQDKNEAFDPLRVRADHATGRAEAATNDAKKRVEKAEGTLQVRGDTKRATEAFENAQSHTASVIETASTQIDPDNPNITPIEVEALEGIDDTTRASLATNKTERKIEASATGQAVAAQNQEIADVFLSSSAPGSAAVRAAGVAGTAGVARVQASATSELAKFRQDNVNAAMTLFADQGYSSDPTTRGKTPDGYSDLLKVATGDRLRDTKRTDPITGVETTLPGSEPTEEQQEAAMQLIFNTGSADAISTIYDRLAKLPTSTDDERRTKLKLEQSFARIASAGKRPKSIRGGIIGKLSSGDVGPDSTVKGLPGLSPFQSIAFEILAKGKLAAESFAEADQEELRIWAETLTLPGVRDRFSFKDPGKPESGPDPDRQVETSIVNAIRSALTDPLVAKDVKHEQRTQMNDILKAFGRDPIEESEKGASST